MLRLVLGFLLAPSLLLSVAGTNYHLASTKPKDARPITRIVQLLRDMASKIEEDQREDQKTFEKYQCWCEKNLKSFTAAQEEVGGEKNLELFHGGAGGGRGWRFHGGARRGT